MSQSSVPPPPPSTLPEQPSFRQASKYQQRRFGISWWGLLIGLVLGVAGGIYLSWVQFPVIETETRPDQLRGGENILGNEKVHYVVAITLAYSHDSDLGLAIQRLTDLELGNDPLQAVADMTCNLLNSGYAQTSAGLRAVRSMRTFYRLQGRSSCADDLIPDIVSTSIVEIDVPTSTATLPPPPSKTPSSAATTTPSGLVIVPTTAPQREYEGSVFSTFCSTELNGIIEVYVRDFGNREGIPR
ncbi:MAG: AtpZ/AtpI family protein [Anaerolineae bacterium]|nr:AtpZ/AtpI family protein [Anaerolineae bacterium]